MGKPNAKNKLEAKKEHGASKYNAEVVANLRSAFANAFTVEQACLYAGISKVTYYTWIEDRPEFAEQMERARNQVVFKAKQVVVGAVNKGDVETAKWWLKHRHPDEFGGAAIGVTVNFNNFSAQQRATYEL